MQENNEQKVREQPTELLAKMRKLRALVVEEGDQIIQRWERGLQREAFEVSSKTLLITLLCVVTTSASSKKNFRAGDFHL